MEDHLKLHIKYIDRIEIYVHITADSDPKMNIKDLSASEILFIIKQLLIGSAVTQTKPSEYQLSESAELIAQEILDWGEVQGGKRTKQKLQSN